MTMTSRIEYKPSFIISKRGQAKVPDTYATIIHKVIKHIRESDRDLHESMDIYAFYYQVLSELMGLTRAKYGALGLFGENGEIMEFITLGMPPQAQNRIKQMPLGHGILREVYQSKDVYRVENISQSPAAAGFPEGHPQMNNLIGIQICVEDAVDGALYLADKQSGELFTRFDEDLLLLFAKEFEHVIHKNKLFTRLNSQNEELRKSNEELKEIQNQILQSEKMASLGQLAAGVAHEINNPIGYINSNLNSLQGYIDDVLEILQLYEESERIIKQQPKILKKIHDCKVQIDLPFIKNDIVNVVNECIEGTVRVKQIVKDLKDFSHTDEGEWRVSDIHSGMESTLNIVHNELKYKVEVVKEFGNIPPIECIQSQLNQVFMNLLVNAAHAIEERGTITIRTGIDCETQVWIAISDTGKGIAEEHVGKLFDPFFTTKPVGKGTGLGLSLSYGIVHRHGGHIKVESQVDAGSTFTIVLPVQQQKDKLIA